MRYALALVLAGCTAQAAPPFGGGGSAPQSGGDMIAADKTLAQCQAVTPAIGDLCYPTDSPYTMVARSATWSYRYPGIGFDVTPPPSAGWTARNSASVASAGGVRTITVAASTTEYRLETRALPAAPYYVEICLQATHAASNQIAGGWYQTSDGKFIQGGWGLDTDIVYQDWNNFTSFAGSNTGSGTIYYLGPLLCMKYVDDNTDRKLYAVDPLGNAMKIGADDGRTVFITADAFHWGVSANSALIEQKVSLVHYETGTP